MPTVTFRWPTAMPLKEVMDLRSSEGPSLLFGQPAPVVLQTVCGARATFESHEPHHELDENGRVVSNEVDEADYLPLVETSGNGLYMHVGTHTVGRTPSDACRNLKRDVNVLAKEQDKRQKNSWLQRERSRVVAKKARKALSATPPGPVEVYDSALPLQYAVRRIRKKLGEHKIHRNDITRDLVFAMVDEYYALPTLSTLKGALEACDNIEDEQEVEELLKPVDSTLPTSSKRKRRAAQVKPKAGSVHRGAVVTPEEPGVVARVLSRCSKPTAPHRDLQVGPSIIRPIAENSRTRAAAKRVGFAPTLAVEEDGSIWPVSPDITTDIPHRDPYEIAEAVRELNADLFEYLLELLFSPDSEESGLSRDEDYSRLPPRKRTRSGTPDLRRRKELWLPGDWPILVPIPSMPYVW